MGPWRVLWMDVLIQGRVVCLMCLEESTGCLCAPAGEGGTPRTLHSDFDPRPSTW